MAKIKVFLGGTCNNSAWRDELIPLLKVDYFNPIVDDWTPECQKEEVKQKDICDYCLYVITPKITGVYSIAEVVDDSNKNPEKTILCVLENDNDDVFTDAQIKSLKQVKEMIKGNNAIVLDSLEEVASFLNKSDTNSLVTKYIIKKIIKEKN